MLSRVAERMYWFGRYLERAENTARLVRVNTALLLDLPTSIDHIWSSMISITGSSDLFYERHQQADERSVIRFLLTDEANPGSVMSSIKSIRENVRTTRDILPSEAWEQINEFYLYAKDNIQSALSRKGRHDFLDDTSNFCHMISGFLASSLSHDDAFNFKHIGRILERADMTTRIVDVGCMNLLTNKIDIPESYQNTLWMNVLRTLSAYQMYRQHVQDRVNGEDVVDFLMKDEHFPRSLNHCMGELIESMTPIDRNDHPIRSVTRVQRLISDLDVKKLFAGNLHEFIDQLQIELSDIHNQLAQTWFDYATQSQEQSQSQS